jgi:hypothetical protein
VAFSVAIEALLPERDDGGTADRIGRLLDVREHSTGAQFLNLAGPGRADDAYTAANHRRLAALRRRYDPDNLFRSDQALPLSPAPT